MPAGDADGGSARRRGGRAAVDRVSETCGIRGMIALGTQR
jgi:hypothetical protein